MKNKYTVFLDVPDRDIDDPPYWAQVSGETLGRAVSAARRLAAKDYNEAYGVGFKANAETFPLHMIVDGWPAFAFELKRGRAKR